MPHIDNHLFNGKGIKKNLKLVLEQGDGLIESIKQGMKEHNLNKVQVGSVDGKIQEAVINYFEGGNFKASVIRNKEILNASGSFTISYDDLFGQMKIVTSDKPPVHGTLVRGKAEDGFIINLTFVEIKEEDE
tara:strand:+ start:641 stop:1036 length:396 start_codon:yes stop_codon:yes gene_type:complete